MLRSSVTARWLWALGIASVLLAGCYTVIVHPKFDGEKLSGEYLRANCIDCHADYNVYPYDPYDYYFGADYFWNYPQFGYYYSYPWWVDDYYWDYYLYGGDPDFYFSFMTSSADNDEFDERTPLRPDYHGSIPRRSPGEVSQTDSSGIDTTAGDDEEPKKQVRTQPMHIPPDMSSPTLEGRTPGKPPWTRPKGWWGAKPPKLRVIAAELESRPKHSSKSSKKSSKKSTGKTVNSSTSSSDEKEDDSKSEEKTEEPKPAERRGRPKRGPP
jgi:hypothetical protein